MRHIKILSLLIIAIMTATLLCACTKESDETKKTPNTSDVTTMSEESAEPQEDQAQETPETSANNPITSKEDMDEIIAALLSDSAYSTKDGGDKTTYTTYTYDLNNNNKTDYDFDFSIKLANSTKFTMPVNVKDLNDKGWDFENSNAKESTLEPNTTQLSSTSLTNNTYKIGGFLSNNSDKTATAKNCDISAVELNLYGVSYSPDYHYSKFEYAPDFTICDSITNNSTVQDVINRLGAPTKITLTDNSEYNYFEIKLLYVQNSDSNQQLEIIFSGENNCIVKFYYGTF